jgi:hypothetical protein
LLTTNPKPLQELSKDKGSTVTKSKVNAIAQSKDNNSCEKEDDKKKALRKGKATTKNEDREVRKGI